MISGKDSEIDNDIEMKERSRRSRRGRGDEIAQGQSTDSSVKTGNNLLRPAAVD